MSVSSVEHESQKKYTYTVLLGCPCLKIWKVKHNANEISYVMNNVGYPLFFIKSCTCFPNLSRYIPFM